MSGDASDFRAPHLRTNDFLGVFAVLENADGIVMVENRRVIGGREITTHDLPGGQVEPGELLTEALIRELQEELGITPTGTMPLLFIQEGLKRVRGQRVYAWRSFFFTVSAYTGTLGTGVEALPWQRISRQDILRNDTAPYHDSFHTWLQQGGLLFPSFWDEDD